MARSVRPWRGQPAAVAVGIHNLRADGRQLILEIQRHGRELAAKLGLGRRDDVVEDRLPSRGVAYEHVSDAGGECFDGRFLRRRTRPPSTMTSWSWWLPSIPSRPNDMSLACMPASQSIAPPAAKEEG